MDAHELPPEDYPPADYPKVTAAHLRRASSLCALRLAHEHADRRSNRRSAARFRVANHLTEQARLLHADHRAPRPEHFRADPELTPEEQRVFAIAAGWYVALFGDEPARLADVDAFETIVDPPAVRLVGPAGLPLEHSTGTREIRLLRLAGVAPPRDLLDDVTVRFAVLRLAGWAAAGPVRVQIADLVHGRLDGAELDLGTVLPELRAWLGDRVDVIRTRIEQPRPIVGLDCAQCGFVPRCGAHK